MRAQPWKGQAGRQDTPLRGTEPAPPQPSCPLSPSVPWGSHGDTAGVVLGVLCLVPGQPLADPGPLGTGCCVALPTWLRPLVATAGQRPPRVPAGDSVPCGTCWLRLPWVLVLRGTQGTPHSTAEGRIGPPASHCLRVGPPGVRLSSGAGEVRGPHLCPWDLAERCPAPMIQGKGTPA